MSNQVAYSANKKIKIRIKWRKQELVRPDLLEKIFDGVPVSDLFKNVSAVCHSWQLRCWHFLCWEKDELDLSVTNATLEKPLNEIGVVACSTRKYAQSLVDIKLMELLKSIMEDNDAYGIYLARWRLSIRKVSIPENIKISDTHLIYISERTTGLEELDLLGSSRITGAGFTKALCNWKNVKSIRLGKNFLSISTPPPPPSKHKPNSILTSTVFQWLHTISPYTYETGVNVSRILLIIGRCSDIAYSHGKQLTHLSIQQVMSTTVKSTPFPINHKNIIYLIFTVCGSSAL
ncbi:hypothetical protein LWI28_002868 [Acer negundo]|uniref:F-box domain-containing protein n=1 Tax=Acer negundo TaxID=4023 RepID=A0AAD5J2Y5_ACENE|nr:hypothetical protein LWI28_002868 [Acer negundo]